MSDVIPEYPEGMSAREQALVLLRNALQLETGQQPPDRAVRALIGIGWALLAVERKLSG